MAPPSAWNAVVGSHGEQGSGLRRAGHRRDRAGGCGGSRSARTHRCPWLLPTSGRSSSAPSPKGPPQPRVQEWRAGSLQRSDPTRRRRQTIPLPGPLQQGISCDSGAEVVFRLVDGRSVTYGPRRIPGPIAAFRSRASAAIYDCISKTPSADAVGAELLALAGGSVPASSRWLALRGTDRLSHRRSTWLRWSPPPYLCAISVVAQGPAPWLSRT